MSAELTRCKSSFSRVSSEQLDLLLSFMEEHPAFAAGKQSIYSRFSSSKLWRLLAERLNAAAVDSGGARKSPDKWCRVRPFYFYLFYILPLLLFCKIKLPNPLRANTQPLVDYCCEKIIISPFPLSAGLGTVCTTWVLILSANIMVTSELILIELKNNISGT